MQNDQKSTKKRRIDLSTIYFYKDELPKNLQLASCGLNIPEGGEGTLIGLYGHRAKQEGFLAAKTYADKHNLKFTVIDYLVELDEANSPLIRNENLKDHDFLSLGRITKDLTNEINKQFIQKADENIDTAELNKAVTDNPNVINKMMKNDRFSHIKVFVHSAKLSFSEKPMSIAQIPHKYWGNIVESNCRLDPLVHIKLDPPKDKLKDATKDEISKVDTETKRKPRNKLK